MLDAVERWAHLHTAQPQMICGAYEGGLMTMLCRMARAKTAVEIGAFVGYSTICIARGLDNGGRLHTFEINEEYEETIRRHIEMAEVDGVVSLHIGDAKELIPTLFDNNSGLDFAFIDAEKRSCRLFYDMMVPMIRPGGVLVVDNVLWGGKVTDYDGCNDLDTRLFRDFNDYVQSDSRVMNVMLPVRDGLMVCLKNFV